MATTVFLVRHASHDQLRLSLAGRTGGVHLNARGRKEAERLAERLSGRGITSVQAGPLERTRETAEAIAARLSLPVRVSEAIGETDFGDWSGMRFSTLLLRNGHARVVGMNEVVAA